MRLSLAFCLCIFVSVSRWHSACNLGFAGVLNPVEPINEGIFDGTERNFGVLCEKILQRPDVARASTGPTPSENVIQAFFAKFDRRWQDF